MEGESYSVAEDSTMEVFEECDDVEKKAIVTE